MNYDEVKELLALLTSVLNLAVKLIELWEKRKQNKKRSRRKR